VQDFREDLGDIENYRHELFRETVEAANYAAEHPGIHYGGRFETTELFLDHWGDEEIFQRFEASLEKAEELKQELEIGIEDLRFDLEEYTEEEGEKTDDYHVFKEELNDAERTLEQMEKEIQHIQEMKEKTPEDRVDQDYVEEKENKVKNLVEGLDYTPKRREKS
jgi:hypothetical protein